MYLYLHACLAYIHVCVFTHTHIYTLVCTMCLMFLLLTLFYFISLQLENYSKTEEAKVEELIKAVADSGAKVIVSGGAVGEMALHFCERYKCVNSYLLFFMF